MALSCSALASVGALPSGITAIDPSGNIWIAGGATGGIPVTDNAYQKQPIQSTCGFYQPSSKSPVYSIPCKDAFVIKLDPSATNVLYATYLGGHRDAAVFAVAFDQTGNVYITG